MQKLSNKSVQEIDFIEIFNVINHGKWVLSLVVSFFLILSIIYVSSLPNLYQSKALLSPVETSNAGGSMANYAGLVNFAGLNLSQNAQSNHVEAMKKLNSLSFFKEKILPNIFLPDLVAVEAWDPNTNIITYKETIYSIDEDKWVQSSSDTKKNKPSAQESFKIFQEKHLKISKESNTGFVTISIKHQSPHVAKEWIEVLVNQINIFYRDKDRYEALKAVDYLNLRIGETNFNEIKEVMAELLQKEIQKLTLIEVNEAYVFNYIDPPAAMEKKSEPKRALICLIGFLMGLIIGIFTIFFKHFRLKK